MPLSEKWCLHDFKERVPWWSSFIADLFLVSMLRAIFNVPDGYKHLNRTLFQIRYQQNNSSSFVLELKKENSNKTPCRLFFSIFSFMLVLCCDPSCRSNSRQNYVYLYTGKVGIVFRFLPRFLLYWSEIKKSLCKNTAFWKSSKLVKALTASKRIMMLMGKNSHSSCVDRGGSISQIYVDES